MIRETRGEYSAEPGIGDEAQEDGAGPRAANGTCLMNGTRERSRAPDRQATGDRTEERTWL
jgi:hypothetical protein